MQRYCRDCRCEWIKPDGMRERVAVKQLDATSSWDLALRERNAMEAVKEKSYALPFYGLCVAGAATPDATANDGMHNGQDTFFVMG